MGDIPSTGVAVDGLLEALAGFERADADLYDVLMRDSSAVARFCLDTGQTHLGAVWTRFALLAAAVAADHQPDSATPERS